MLNLLNLYVAYIFYISANLANENVQLINKYINKNINIIAFE